MKLLVLLIVLMFCVTVLLTGCERPMEQPIMEIVVRPQSHIDKAKETMGRVNERRAEAQQKAEEAGDFSTILTASEDIFKEELGFKKGFWIDLVEIYREENLENPERLEALDNLEDVFAEKLEEGTFSMFYFMYIRAFDPLIIEYLRLSSVYPEASEEQLLTRFRKTIIDREITIIFP